MAQAPDGAAPVMFLAFLPLHGKLKANDLAVLAPMFICPFNVKVGHHSDPPIWKSILPLSI